MFYLVNYCNYFRKVRTSLKILKISNNFKIFVNNRFLPFWPSLNQSKKLDSYLNHLNLSEDFQPNRLSRKNQVRNKEKPILLLERKDYRYKIKKKVRGLCTFSSYLGSFAKNFGSREKLQVDSKWFET